MAISLLPVPLHVTRCFSEHVLCPRPLSVHLSPFHTTDYGLVWLAHLLTVLQPISLDGMDASLSSPHLSFPGSRSNPHQVGGFGHTPIRRVVFVISASCLLRLYSTIPIRGSDFPCSAFPRRSFRNCCILTTTARDKTQLPNYSSTNSTKNSSLRGGRLSYDHNVPYPWDRTIKSRSSKTGTVDAWKWNPENLSTVNDLNQG